MKEMILALANYFRLPVLDEKGQGMVEYALILVLVSVIALAALGLIGQNVNTVFGKIQTALTTP